MELVTAWLKDWQTSFVLLPSRAVAFMESLTTQGLEAPALELATHLLAVRVEVRNLGEAAGRGRWVTTDVVPVVFDKYRYAALLRDEVRMLAEAWPLPTVQMLVDALNSAIGEELAAHEPPRPRDRSTLWHDAIESDERRPLRDPRSSLLGTLRHASELALKTGVGDAVLSLLGRQRHGCFSRLRLHLLRQLPGAGGLRLAAVLDREAFDDRELWHEYAALLADVFPSLSASDQALVLSWIDTDDDREQVRQLHPIRNSVDVAWKKVYDDLVTKLGLAAEPLSPLSGWDAEAPLSAEQLNRMPLDAVSAFLQGEAGAETVDAATVEAMGDSLAAAASTSPNHWADAADKLSDVAPVYARHVLQGLRDAVRSGSPLIWPPVLRLCRCLVSSTANAHPSAQLNSPDAEQSGQARQVVASLLSDAFHENSGLTPDLAASVWELITLLVDDPVPSWLLEDSDADALTIAANTTSGQAMRAALLFAAWEMERIRASGAEQSDLAALPGVAALLDAKLADTSPAVRAPYVQFLRLLHWLDGAWTQRNISRIFSEDPAGNAAWQTYIRWVSVYEPVSRLLGPWYERAVDELTGRAASDVETARKRRFGGGLPEDQQRLAEHMYIAAWLRWSELATAVDRFFAVAPAEVRASGATNIGTLLHDDSEASQELRRNLPGLRRLWDERLQHLAQGDEELAAFGWWFASGVFADKDGLAPLHRTVEKTEGAPGRRTRCARSARSLGRKRPRRSDEGSIAYRTQHGSRVRHGHARGPRPPIGGSAEQGRNCTRACSEAGR